MPRRLGFTVQKLRAGSRAPASWSDRPRPRPDNCRPGFRRRPCVRLHLTHAPTVPQKLWPKHKTPKKRPSRNRLRPKRRKKSRNATRRPAVNHGVLPDRRTNSGFGPVFKWKPDFRPLRADSLGAFLFNQDGDPRHVAVLVSPLFPAGRSSVRHFHDPIFLTYAWPEKARGSQKNRVQKMGPRRLWHALMPPGREERLPRDE